MKTFSVKSDASSSNGMRTITIEGDLTLKNSSALKEELLAAFPKGQDTHIAVKKLVDIDLSGLQLLVALKKYLLQSGIRPTLEVELPDELRSLAECSGYIDQLK